MAQNQLYRLLVPDDAELDELEAAAVYADRFDADTTTDVARRLMACNGDPTRVRRSVDRLLAGPRASSDLRVDIAHHFAVDASDARRILTVPDATPANLALTYISDCLDWDSTREAVWDAMLTLASDDELVSITELFLRPTTRTATAYLPPAPDAMLDLLAAEVARRARQGPVPEALMSVDVVDRVARIDPDAAIDMIAMLPVAPHKTEHVDMCDITALVELAAQRFIPTATCDEVVGLFRNLRSVPWTLHTNARCLLDAVEGFTGAQHSVLVDMIDPQLSDGTRTLDVLDELAAGTGDTLPDLWSSFEIEEVRCAALYTLAANPNTPRQVLIDLTEMQPSAAGSDVPMRQRRAATLAGFRRRRSQLPVDVVMLVDALGDIGRASAVMSTLEAVCDHPAELYATWVDLAAIDNMTLLELATSGHLTDDVIDRLPSRVLASVAAWETPVRSRIGEWFRANIDADRVELASELAGNVTVGELAALTVE